MNSISRSWLWILATGVTKLLGFFLDSLLTRAISSATPKRFLSPTAGIAKWGTVYLGDPYTSELLQAAAIGAATLYLSDASEFLPAGQAKVGTQTVSYTGISGYNLTGVTGLTVAQVVGTVVTPLKNWVSRSQISVVPAGADSTAMQVSLRPTGGTSFSFPGMPLILAVSSVALGATPIEIDVQVTVPAGGEQEFTNWSVVAGAFYPKAIGDSSSIPATTIGVSAVLNGYVNRRDQALPPRLRVLPINRSVATPPPGFVIGQYCWRDDTEINEQTVIPTNWLTDPTTLGNEKFIAGIGCEDDLKPLGFTQQDDSVHLKIDRGFYFTGPKGYYLPATPQLDFISSLATTLQLSAVPQQTIPIFVGIYALDSQGFYEKSIEYRYKTAAAVAAGAHLPEYYYTIDRATNSITLNQAMSVTSIYLGTITGEPTDYFDIPVYPVDSVESIYVLRSDGSQVFAINWSFDRDLGTVVISNPAGTGSSIAGTLLGEAVMATCAPAVAVLYETGTAISRVLDTVDLNPAFAGISGGYVYLQHTRQEVESLVLACDKPLIDIPATFSSIIGLVAYGPVYFDGDYSLLQVTAYSKVPGQIVQGAKLQVIADPTTFTGTLNYLDPTVEPVIVTTGADGVANLIFRPAEEYGFYIPAAAASGSLAGLKTTSIANDTIVLPQPVPVSQLYDSTETQPWMVTLYSVANNNPMLGMVGGITNKGEVLWATSGTPGTTTYKTNGERDPFLSSSQVLYPIEMLDTNGRNNADPLFNGSVIALVYAQAVPTGSAVGSYFVTFIQRTLLRIEVVDSNVESNSILLQMAMPSLVDDDVWLILNDAVHGILNQYRLGWTEPTS